MEINMTNMLLFLVLITNILLLIGIGLGLMKIDMILTWIIQTQDKVEAVKDFALTFASFIPFYTSIQKIGNIYDYGVKILGFGLSFFRNTTNIKL